MKYASFMEILPTRRDKRAQERLGKYPCCDLINRAIRYILDNKPDDAIDELFRAILQADGYFYRHLADEIIDAHNRVNDRKLNNIKL